MLYNIALVPKNISDKLIKLAQLFRNQTDYLLSDGSRGSTVSNPHITLTQFCVPENFNLDDLWNEVKRIQGQLHITELVIHLNRTDSKIDSEQQFAWLRLLIERNELCYQLHVQLFQMLKQRGIECINASLDNFLPHLTLVRTSDLSLIDKLKIIKPSFRDVFYLVLGKSDEIGQLVKILRMSNI